MLRLFTRVVMTALHLAEDISSPVEGCVEAGCSGRLGNPGLVSGTPIRFLGENPSASLGAHSVPGIGYSLMERGKATTSVFAQPLPY